MNSVCVSVSEFFNEWVSRKAHIVMISVLVSTLLVVNIKTAEARLSELNDKNNSLSKPHLIWANAKIYPEINIPKGSVRKAIQILSKQTGKQISTGAIVVEGLKTEGFKGRMSAKKALTRLLAGTKLKIRQVDDLGFIIKRPNVRTAQAGGEILLDGITVYGEKTERDLQETTTSVQVFTSDDLENSTVQDLDDVLDQTANVTQRFGGEGFAIRGINNTTVSGNILGSGPLASLYIDGASISTYAIRTGIEELWDVEQIEVLRGPQSTTQGRNTLAGAIIIKTKDPTYNLEAAARGGLGTQNSALFSGMVNVPIIKNKLAVRVAVDLQKTDGFNSNPTLNIEDQAFNENKSVRGKVLFEPSDKIKNTLTLAFSKNESGDDAVDFTNPFQRNFFGNIQGKEATDQLIATLDTKITLNDKWYLNNTISFNRAEYDRIDDDDGSITGANGPNDFFEFSRQNVTDTFTEELRLHYQGDNLKGHIGAYYSKVKEDDKSGGTTLISDTELLAFGIPSSLLPFYTGLTLDTDRTGDREIESYAAFGELSYDFNKFLTIFGGLRYDREKFENLNTDNRNFLTALPDPVADCGAFGAAATAGCVAVNGALSGVVNQRDDPGAQTEFDAWLPSLGVTLNWQEDISTSFFVKRGYRSGNAGTSFVSFTPYEVEPEYVWNYEASLRSQWFDKKLTLNANIFYMDWTDQQVGIIGPGGPQDVFLVNAGKSELKGFEVEAFALPIEQLKLRGSVGYVETKFIEFSTNGKDYTGNEFPNAPKWTLAGSARYSFDNGIYVHADANYRSKAFTEPNNDPSGHEDARTLVNAKIGYKTEKIDAYIYSTNIFDEDYVSSIFEFNDTGKIGDGRTVGVRLNMKLD